MSQHGIRIIPYIFDVAKSAMYVHLHATFAHIIHV